MPPNQRGRPKSTPKRIRRRLGSKASQLEAFLTGHTAVACGTPQTFAADASCALGVPCKPQEVWRVLKEMGYSSHVRSPVPGLALRSERVSHAMELQRYWTRANQMLFLDEKKFRANHLRAKLGKRAYCAIGSRPRRQMFVPTQNSLPPKCEIVGVYGVVPPGPLFGDATRIGDLGLVAFNLVEGNLTFQDVLDFIEFTVCPLLTPWPGPNSILQLDNMPQHTASMTRIRNLIESRGALCIFQPPNSPDLNMIEHMWATIQTRVSANMLDKYMKNATLGTPLYNFGNLVQDCRDSRETFHAFDALFAVEL